MFAKSDVNGKDQNPIYEFLKSRCPSVRAEFQASYKLYYEPYHQDDIRWATTIPVLDENFSLKKHLEHFSPGGILKSSSWTMRVSLFVAMMNPSILQSLWVPFFTDDHILSKSKQVLLTSFLAAGSRHRRFIGQVRARPCILDPHPPILTPILRIQVWKSLPWSGHNDPSGLKLCCPVGDCVPTLWLLCIRVTVSQCCWMEEIQ